jgi:hypothetical protein
MVYLTIVILAAIISGTLTGGRARLPLVLPKRFFTAVFEWFGELGIFCSRLLRTAVVPPYEFGDYSLARASIGDQL